MLNFFSFLSVVCNVALWKKKVALRGVFSPLLYIMLRCGKKKLAVCGAFFVCFCLLYVMLRCGESN